MKSFPKIKDALFTEYKNLSHFAAPAMIAGILLAFGGFHPPITGISILLFILLLGMIRFHQIRPIGILLIFLFWGTEVTTYRTTHIHTPTVSHFLSDLEVEGQIKAVIPLYNSQKVILDTVHFLNESAEAEPVKIALTYDRKKPVLSPGDKIRFKASLRPPVSAVAPGGYNEAQSLYFQNIGAVGTIQKIIAMDSAKNRNILSDLRFKINNRIQSVLPFEIAQIAIALTIGEQKAISPELYRLFQGAGISHILSVSGFHMGLLALFVFIFIRFILALIPFIPDSFPNKKIAVFFSLLIITGYLFISGMHVPALRSYIMIFIVLAAILFDRNAFSLRSLNIAAILILSYAPELILEIGFQLSFMAVLVLISLYHPLYHLIFPQRAKTLLNRFGRLLFSIFLTSFLIGLNTLPLISYHFNQYALYSILGNILTIIFFSFFIMPFLFGGLLFMPIGGDFLFLKVAGIGIGYLISVCDIINRYPKALLYIPSFNASALLTMTAGLLLLLIMKTKLRFCGILFLLSGLLLAVRTQKPDLMIGDRGQTIAVREDNGSLKFIACSDNPYTARIWLIKNGDSPVTPPASHREIQQLQIKGKKISFDTETCGKSDLCFLPVLNPAEPNALSLFDFKNRYIYIQGDKISVQTP